MPATPTIVTEEEWAAANAAQLEREKAQMKAHDDVAAARRRLPMVEMDPGYVFEGQAGPLTFLELFDGRPQLIVYNFMLTPGSDHLCSGCSMVVDNLPDLSHVRARDITFTLASRVPREHLERVRREMGWGSVPWVSSSDAFNEAVGALVDGQDTFRYTAFLRDGDRIFKTYATAGRGLEDLGSSWGLIDSTVYGRREEWQDSPDGWEQEPPYAWWGLHTEYGDEARPGAVR